LPSGIVTKFRGGWENGPDRTTILEDFLRECNRTGNPSNPNFDILAGFGSGDVQNIFADVDNTISFLAD
jgi:hypothetical protein